MKKAYLSIERLKALDESINWLSDYTPTEGEIHHIGKDIDTIDEEKTKLLNELGIINKRRKEILKTFRSN